jgi:hypothetical protein
VQKLDLRTPLGQARVRWEVWAAVRQVHGLCRSDANVRVCWDLDNTLVDSGALLRTGARLSDAIVEAKPVPNMLRFFDALRANLPTADHIVVTARRRSMRRATEAWLRRYGVAAETSALCFVPYAEAKVKLWEQLAGDARLVIVDDLGYGHEDERPSRHIGLVEVANRVARVYIGDEEIARIVASPTAIEPVVGATLRALGNGAVTGTRLRRSPA